jgi:DNA-binding transcriptional LysR family regulator
VSIRDLKTFLAVIESGSFAGAALAVRRTQSAVTVQMKTLENELGFALFDRSKRPPILTDAGRAFAVKTADAVEVYERLFQDLGGNTVEGQLRLGVVPSVITGIMPQALVALRAKYPSLHIKLAMGLSADLVERVRQGALDAAIVSDLVQGGAGLEWSPFMREPLVLIAPIDVPQRTAEELVISYPFIRYNRQAWAGQLIDNFLKRRRLRVTESMTLDTLEAITTMVHYGLGVSIVPLRSFGDPFSLPVRRLTFSGPAVYRVVGLVRKSDDANATLAETLLTELRALSAPISPSSKQRKKPRTARK